MPSGIINTITFKINLYTQWSSKYGHNRDTYVSPSGNINTVSRNINPHAVSLHALSGNNSAVPEIINSIQVPSGNINIVLEIYKYTPSGYLNTTKIEKHIPTPSGHMNTVPINLAY